MDAWQLPIGNSPVYEKDKKFQLVPSDYFDHLQVGSCVVPDPKQCYCNDVAWCWDTIEMGPILFGTSGLHLLHFSAVLGEYKLDTADKLDNDR